MITVALDAPALEADRLAKLRELVVLDSEPEPVFDSITRMASEVCGTPIALISLIDLERQWFKANVGMPGVNQTSRDIAFCAHAIETDDVMEVADARADRRFANNPLVTGTPDIRFYAGAPLILPTGQRMGTLCVIDRSPRQLNEEQTRTLRSLAAIVTSTLVMRRDLIERSTATLARHQQALAHSERFMRQIADNLPVRIAYVDAGKRYRFVNQAHCERFGLSRYQILGRTRNELKGGQAHADVEQRIDAVLAGQSQQFEFEESSSRGMRRIQSTLVPDVLANGEVAGIFATGVDITERAATERALRELTAILDNTSDFITQIDARGTLTYMNPAARAACGLTAYEPLGERNYRQFNTPATLRLHEEVVLPTVREHGIWVGKSTVYGAGGRIIPVSHMVIAHRGETGRIERFSTVMRDITTETASQRQLQRQTSMLQSVTEAMPSMVVVIGADRRCTFVNTATERWIGRRREEMLGLPISAVFGNDFIVHYEPGLSRAFAGETVAIELVPQASVHGQGASHLSVTLTPLSGADEVVESVVLVAVDVTLQRREEQRLHALSRRDSLSGLLNRAGFEHYISECRSDVSVRTLALLYIDLDRFKQVNDRHGHPVGDQVIERFSRRLQKIVRPGDGVARLGGDEFAIALPDITDPTVAQRVAESVIAAALRPMDVNGETLSIGASVGIAFSDNPTLDWADTVARADRNLYAAKAQGRGRVVAGSD
jgi:diguanylate cyclase (GGDEF)-like protein/PAS domain S-box-containing protein